jgi:chloramphenicol O-acetyltransferase type A
MAAYTIIDQDTWSRKNTFDYFSEFELPFFNITANVEVSALKSFCTKNNYSFFLASLFFAMKAANAIAEFKMRIRGEEIIQHEDVRVGSTIQYEDHSFGFCYFPYMESIAEFNEEGTTLLNKALADKTFSPKDGSDDLLHFSVIPWLHFKGFQHARRIGQQDSIPKIVFGKYQYQGESLFMPVNVEVHHALADGYHAGLFFDKFQYNLNNLV